MELANMRLETEQGVATLIFDRDEKMNALTSVMRMDLARVIQAVREDDEIKALIVTGAGRAFCAGSDVGDRLAKRIAGEKIETSRKEILQPVGFLALELRNLHKPTIAAINGVAAGSGFSLALFCDIRIASKNAKFIASWVKMGLSADMGATYALPRLLGTSKAFQIVATGDSIDALEAERIGLVSSVVPEDELVPRAKALALKLASGPSVSIELMKRAIYRGIHNDLERQLDFESYAQNICRQTEDHREAVKAFAEKRQPSFKGR